ncbi:hypothetical protein GCM10012278_70990 [Nonomuraea glycinis]|uniref:Uncharacterized protein n=1 Tax=Nonomuraea glycinis TaxID=2047744 RepID=A0A918ACR5_9ACTN|nr:hypothetical protein GCM10012278_70990 [Nonomuraea glycinis]
MRVAVPTDTARLIPKIRSPSIPLDPQYTEAKGGMSPCSAQERNTHVTGRGGGRPC